MINLKKPVTAAVITTAYFLVYAVLYFTGASAHTLVIMLILSPLFLIYMAISVIRDRNYTTRDLKDGEEFSYKDWPEGSEMKKD